MLGGQQGPPAWRWVNVLVRKQVLKYGSGWGPSTAATGCWVYAKGYRRSKQSLDIWTAFVLLSGFKHPFEPAADGLLLADHEDRLFGFVQTALRAYTGERSTAGVGTTAARTAAPSH